ncbi:MAG: hypothetical protein N3E48_00890 [Candidatus Bathyarchaeota archaeon]|nr:hypothetical protein [Candidatus Bathyarchaeota archaeon]
MLNETIEKKVDKRFRFLTLLTLKIDQSKLENVGKTLTKNQLVLIDLPNPQSFTVIDDLNLFEASILTILLEKRRLVKGEDFEVVSNPQNTKFTLIASSCRAVDSALKTLDKIRSLNQTKKYALKILSQWQVEGEIGLGETDLALNIGYKILKEKTRICNSKCPKCGRESPSKIVEKISEDGKSFIIYAKRMCCEHIIKRIIPIKRETQKILQKT